MGKVIGVISLKGGVGKTSSVVSLGASFASLGKKVLLVDANFSAPNLGMHLNIMDPKKSLHDVFHDCNPQDAIHKLEHFDVLPASVFPKVRSEPLKLKNKLRHLRRKYDVVLLDSSPSLNEETLAVILAADELLVVTTPDYSTLTMTLKAIKLAKQRGTPIKGIILNRVYNKNFELSLDEIERSSEVPVMAVIPHDVRVMRSQAHFVPSIHLKPKSSLSEEYMKLAAVLVGEKYDPRSSRNLFRKVVPKRQDINREIFYRSIFR
ncbi:AAA family ATPase [archaeon]|jgi:MinD-like ATPase involved in chromosome partitioning or flagellar assembly|nr:AAA family ATPase [archaeon]